MGYILSIPAQRKDSEERQSVNQFNMIDSIDMFGYVWIDILC